MSDNTLRVRLDNDHWQMLLELCQTNDRTEADQTRKLIRDAHVKMVAEREEKKR